MKMIALTGISRDALDDLFKRGIRTFEVRSTHNVIAFSDITPGDKVFITDVIPSDLNTGDCGYITTVRSTDIRMHRITYGTSDSLEERETMSARIQLVVNARGKVRSVTQLENYKPVIVDVIDVHTCEAR
ncbi:DUF473 domain-containing protein [Methanocella sp. CWC-04]|uniref:DUF473 domain-containing protein n=1 Tax=Methanooceanicella nereidis TaxID=2052831 RepID=A0AAP2REX5_9EURY|nr:DUF473 domain-containing protein [Methanocella sp. CWC-04]MCD1294947.1 DUF473 domain-containing protein [Methanocella sp. CWC-04]